MIDNITKYILNEGYVLSDKTISVNLDKFESGESNKLLIIGVCGSGKTTWAEFLSKNMARMVKGKYPARLPRVKWRSIDTMYWTLSQKTDFKDIQNDTEAKKALIRKLVRKEVIKLLKNNDRMIIEGADFIDIYRDEPQYRKLILNQPMIVLGISALRAGIKAGIRNMNREGGEGIRELYWMSMININDLQGPLNMMRKDITKLSNVNIEGYRIPKL